MKNQKISIWLLTSIFTGLSILCSCKKFVSIAPPINQLTAESTFSNDATANSAINGIYSRLSQSGLMQGLTPYTGMYADELVNYSPGLQSEFTLSHLTIASSPTLNSNFWSTGYQFIYSANAAIEQLSKSSGVSNELKSTLTAEAKFIRAYLYLNLSALFGDVPLVLETGYNQTSFLPRAQKSKIMAQIITDLKDAALALPDRIDPERIRANRWAAMALLSRAYLYDGQYEQAAQTADEIIESKRYSLVTDPGKVFLKNSTEAILQFFPTQTGQNTPDGLTFLPASPTETQKYYLTQSLLATFEPGDQRKTSWTASRAFVGQTYFYPTKYKIINTATLSEYLMILRLGEQYLIRAEARIQLGNIENAIADLNILRKRARSAATPALPEPLPDLDKAMPRAQAIIAVEHERRIEMMCETGHRWFDLQRTGQAGIVLQNLKPDTWSSKAVNWPIPDEQLRLNPNLEQNPGYTK